MRPVQHTRPQTTAETDQALAAIASKLEAASRKTAVPKSDARVLRSSGCRTRIRENPDAGVWQAGSCYPIWQAEGFQAAWCRARRDEHGLGRRLCENEERRNSRNPSVLRNTRAGSRQIAQVPWFPPVAGSLRKAPARRLPAGNADERRIPKGQMHQHDRLWGDTDGVQMAEGRRPPFSRRRTLRPLLLAHFRVSEGAASSCMALGRSGGETVGSPSVPRGRGLARQPWPSGAASLRRKSSVRSVLRAVDSAAASLLNVRDRDARFREFLVWNEEHTHRENTKEQNDGACLAAGRRSVKGSADHEYPTTA